MKTTVVPAQITTVEDKIAGSLNFIQIILLVFSLIIGTAFYGLIPPKLHLSTLKIVLIGLEFVVLGTLALRYKGRILADWLVVYLRYKARPRVYLFDKNDITARHLPISISKSREAEILAEEKPTRNNVTKYDKSAEPSYLRTIIAVKPSTKGGSDVEYQEA
jgi:hypothetical protein